MAYFAEFGSLNLYAVHIFFFFFFLKFKDDNVKWFEILFRGTIWEKTEHLSRICIRFFIYLLEESEVGPLVWEEN